MISPATGRRGGARCAFVVLAFVALLLNVLVPPGFMAAPTDGRAFPIVICTGHGPLTLDSDNGSKAPAEKSKPGSVCAFAGHSTPPTPSPAAIIAAPVRFEATRSIRSLTDLAPGRGLAAPPPPSHAPPALLI
jgi:hypothetical protein